MVPQLKVIRGIKKIKWTPDNADIQDIKRFWNDWCDYKAWSLASVDWTYVASGYSCRRNDDRKEKIKNVKILTNWYLQQNWIDAHQLKYDWLWNSAPIAQYDLYKHTSTWEIWIFKKWGKWEL